MTKEHETFNRYVEVCLDSMKADGARLTKTRKAVLDCLAHTNTPLTPHEIMEQINTNNSKATSKIDLVSVYRILKYLSDLSLVHQVGAEGGYFPCAHTTCKKEVHAILNCSNCNDTQELHIPDTMSSEIISFLKKTKNFTTNNHGFEIKGTCKKCSN